MISPEDYQEYAFHQAESFDAMVGEAVTEMFLLWDADRALNARFIGVREITDYDEFMLESTNGEIKGDNCYSKKMIEEAAKQSEYTVVFVEGFRL